MAQDLRARFGAGLAHDRIDHTRDEAARVGQAMSNYITQILGRLDQIEKRLAALEAKPSGVVGKIKSVLAGEIQNEQQPI